jgi:hypothetical protein
MRAWYGVAFPLVDPLCGAVGGVGLIRSRGTGRLGHHLRVRDGGACRAGGGKPSLEGAGCGTRSSVAVGRCAADEHPNSCPTGYLVDAPPAVRRRSPT